MELFALIFFFFNAAIFQTCYLQIINHLALWNTSYFVSGFKILKISKTIELNPTLFFYERKHNLSEIYWNVKESYGKYFDNDSRNYGKWKILSNFCINLIYIYRHAYKHFKTYSMIVADIQASNISADSLNPSSMSSNCKEQKLYKTNVL